jgi:hypothetical protein
MGVFTDEIPIIRRSAMHTIEMAGARRNSRQAAKRLIGNDRTADLANFSSIELFFLALEFIGFDARTMNCDFRSLNRQQVRRGRTQGKKTG